jgi:hypothetical protein
MSQIPDSPNASGADANNNAVPSYESIAEKMAAMRENTQRNQMLKNSNETETGSEEEGTPLAPVAPDGEDISQPEVESYDDEDTEATDEAVSPDEVSADESADSSQEELIDFLEFANENPNAKFKFMKNGQEVIIDAKKAAAILGQGGAIHEEARKLKIERAEFDEFIREQQAQQTGLTLAMEFTVQPKLQQAYDEIIKTQGYQSTFQQQLQQTTDPAQIARIQAAIQQNEKYIGEQSEVIRTIKPNVDEFYKIRKQQVSEIIEANRKSFQDKELKNPYVFNELREKISKGWTAAEGQLVPGVSNIDLISSDEHILSLIRDGLKFRNKPTSRSSNNQVSALTSRRTPTNTGSEEKTISALREQAKKGGKEGIKAADNLLMQQLAKLRANRK